MQNGRLTNFENHLIKNHHKWKSLGVQSKFSGKTRVRGRNSAPQHCLHQQFCRYDRATLEPRKCLSINRSSGARDASVLRTNPIA